MTVPLGPGDRIADRYLVEKKLGEGGMGCVFLASHEELKRRCAIKVMHTEAARNVETAARFLREAQAASSLKSDHVVQIFDFARLPGGEPYIVMEYLVGADLAEIVEHQGAIAASDTVAYVRQVCEALQEAHTRPEGAIIHRDIKPANLFLTRKVDGSPCMVVLDFGIAKAFDPGMGAAIQTAPSTLCGSPAYMSPEQIMGLTDIDARTDLWALGVTLYELVTSRKPFEGASMIQLLARITEVEPQPMSDFADVPRALQAVILRCLEKDRDRRWPSAAALSEALGSLASAPAQPADERAAPPRTAPLLSDAATLKIDDAAKPPPPPPGAPEAKQPLTPTRAVPRAARPAREPAKEPATKALAFRTAGELMVVAHTRDNPTASEWDEYIEATRMLQTRYPGRVRVLVLTDGGYPDRAMRDHMARTVNLKAFPAAIVSDAASVRFIVSVLAFLNSQIQSFAPAELPRAYVYLRLSATRTVEVPDLLRQLRAELGPHQVLDAVLNSLKPAT